MYLQFCIILPERAAKSWDGLYFITSFSSPAFGKLFRHAYQCNIVSSPLLFAVYNILGIDLYASYIFVNSAVKRTGMCCIEIFAQCLDLIK